MNKNENKNEKIETTEKATTIIRRRRKKWSTIPTTSKEMERIQVEEEYKFQEQQEAEAVEMNPWETE